MTPIYIKLGTAANYKDEQSGLVLTPQQPAMAIDYDDVNDMIARALNAGLITQIDQVAFFNLPPVSVPPPITIGTNTLITLTNYLLTCPSDNATFYLYQAGQWYPILWSVLKGCIAGRLSVLYRIGVDAAPAPQPNATTYVNASLIGKDPKKIIININGSQIFPDVMYTAGELATTDYFSLDATTGTITRPAKFLAGDIFRLTEA